MYIHTHAVLAQKIKTLRVSKTRGYFGFKVLSSVTGSALSNPIGPANQTPLTSPGFFSPAFLGSGVCAAVELMGAQSRVYFQQNKCKHQMCSSPPCSSHSAGTRPTGQTQPKLIQAAERFALARPPGLVPYDSNNLVHSLYGGTRKAKPSRQLSPSNASR
ncbi:ciliary neurotrophic factor receptor subunit alpha [Platysternon megacephalum]|uniref:Ciliary neurotrophic factor receptor subunit alpha n=1 Tax=Platysternon megacephalum TaxID=55544 RepID=A0A4D9DWN9_9SAUR|nr:ciliary neurotrophic factor receptor subunit alpha [Platysternon megacephalum]